MIRTTTNMTGLPGSPFVSVMYFDGDTQGEADNAAAAVRAFWQALAGQIEAGLTITIDPAVEQVNVGSGQVSGVFNTTTTAVTSSAVGGKLPYATQGLISWRTGFYLDGRELRGRVYVPQPIDNHNSDGVPSSAYRNALQAAADGLLGATADFGIYSRTKAAFASAISAQVWTQFAVQRRRRV